MVVEMIDRGRAFAPNGLPKNRWTDGADAVSFSPMGVNR